MLHLASPFDDKFTLMPRRIRCWILDAPFLRRQRTLTSTWFVRAFGPDEPTPPHGAPVIIIIIIDHRDRTLQCLLGVYWDLGCRRAGSTIHLTSCRRLIAGKVGWARLNDSIDWLMVYSTASQRHLLHPFFPTACSCSKAVPQIPHLRVHAPGHLKLSLSSFLLIS